jgi:heat shock protein HslJ
MKNLIKSLLLITIIGFASNVLANCPDCKAYKGVLNSTGDYDFQPLENYYFSSQAGLHFASLTSAAKADFDLYLWKWQGREWRIAAKSEKEGSEETISYRGTPGYYIYMVYSFNGSGEYTLYHKSPSEQSSESIYGRRWHLTSIKGQAVTKVEAYIEFDEENKRMSGNGGCNLIGGGFEISGNSLKFGPIISTKRACLDNEGTRTETQFLQALQGVTSYRLSNGVLTLYAGNDAVLTFAAR